MVPTGKHQNMICINLWVLHSISSVFNSFAVIITSGNVFSSESLSVFEQHSIISLSLSLSVFEQHSIIAIVIE